MRVILRRFSALLVVILLTSCGSSDEPSDAGNSDGNPVPTDSAGSTPTNAGLDVCSLLTVADLEAATELTWGAGSFSESMSSEQQAVCDWTATSQYATAQVLVYSTDEFFEDNRTSAASVFGLGDPPTIAEADEVYATDEGSLIAMRLAGRFVQVSYIPPGPGNVLAETTALAEAVAGRFEADVR